MLKDVLKFGSHSEFHVRSWSFRIASYKRPQPGAAGCRVPGAAGDVVPAASVLGRCEAERLLGAKPGNLMGQSPEEEPIRRSE